MGGGEGVGGGAYVAGGVHGKGMRMVGGGMHGRGVCVAGGYAWQGAYMAGGMCSRGDMHGRGAYMAGEVGHAWQRGTCMAGGQGGVHGRRNGHCSRQYASYCTAFLLCCGLCPQHLKAQSLKRLSGKKTSTTNNTD